MPPTGLDNEDEYRLLYGGIDSRAVTDRAGDMTALMASVAQRHAAVLSRPIVLRELYLLEDGKRRLLNGVDVTVSPMSEGETVHDIEAIWPHTETLSGPTDLSKGPKVLTLTFLNGTWDEDLERGRHVWIDRFDILDASGKVLASAEVEDFEDESLGAVFDCGGFDTGSFQFYACSGASLRVPIDVPADGARLQVVAGGEQLKGLPQLSIAVESETLQPGPAAEIRRTLASLHEQLLSVTVTADSPDVAEALSLFEETMQRKRAGGTAPRLCQWPEGQCYWHTDYRFFEGAVDDETLAQLLEERDWGHEWNYERVEEIIGETPDPHYVAQSWAVVLAFLMTDYRYLYL